MKVFIVGADRDTGGQGIRIKQAFDRYAPGWQVSVMNRQAGFFKYPSDLAWDEKLAQQLYDEADVVHLRNGVQLYHYLDHGQHKPVVVHHHGSRLRSHPEIASGEAKAIGAVELVSTVDLLEDAPGATWMPAPFDLDWIREKYTPRPRVATSPRIRPLRIAHAPTNRQAKGTERILSALDVLSRRYARSRHAFEVDLIERVEWRVCLSRKAHCDIYIDQITLGYGNNAVEAMAFGIPVISGWSEPADRERFIQEAGTTPAFYEADGTDIEERLEHLILSSELREEWGTRGRAYAEYFHASNRVVERLRAVYESAVHAPQAERIVA